MKKVFSIIIIAVIFITATFAQGTIPWNGTVATSFGGGSGTQQAPYLIKEASQLAYLAKKVNEGEKYTGVYFRLENDLDLGGTLETPSNWEAIGNKAARNFYGIFDGNNKSIHNIYINSPTINYIGLFGFIYNVAIVKNLNIVSGTIIGGQYVGGISGASYGKVENCTNSAYIEGNGSTGISIAGGIVGSNYGTVINCYNAGKVKGKYHIGGIVGQFQKTSISTALIDNCVNTGDIQMTSPTGGNVGGIAHNIGSAEAIISNCYNHGNIYCEGTNTNIRAGGIVGQASSGTIISCYNTGQIYLGGKVGGIAGDKAIQCSITDSYYDKQMCSITKAIGTVDDMETCKGLLTKNMIQASGLTNFDTQVWKFQGDTYPRLKIFENNNLINAYSIPIILSATNEAKYDTRDNVKSDFTLSNALSASWTVVEGSSVTINQSVATVIRPDNGDDEVKLKVTANGVSREIVVTVYQKPVTVTVEQPENGSIIVMDGDEQLTLPAQVESNTVLTLIAVPGDEYMLDTFTVNGNDIEGNTVIITSATVLSARFTIVAPPGPWDGSVATEFGGGSGKEIAPYLIKSANQLAYLAQQVNSGIDYQNQYFKLVYNLDMGENNNWIPIGKYAGDDAKTAFAGIFDGNGKEIRNLYINTETTSEVGLFGYTAPSSEIKNLGLDANCKIFVNNPEGGCMVGGIAGNSRSTITNCYNKGEVKATGTVGGIAGSGGVRTSNCYNSGIVESTNGTAGGIVGVALVATISNCYNSGQVKAAINLGGIIGHSNASTVSECYNIADLSATNANSIGGIAGGMGGSVKIPSIERCANFGNITSSNNLTGGIIGNASGNISNCYNAGTITAQSYLGGIAGRYSGGQQGVLSRCYNIGQVVSTTNDPFTGGIIGYYDGGGLTDLYSDKQICVVDKAVGNRPDIDLVRGTMTSFLTATDGIAGFNSSIWTFENGLYPRLTALKDIEYAVLNASPATLFADGDNNYETVNDVRTNFHVNTSNGVNWEVTKGSTVTISGNNAIVTPRDDANDNVTIRASLGELSKTFNMVITKLVYKLIIDNTVNGSISVKDAEGNPIESGSNIQPNQVITLTATPNEGYHFTKWNDNNTENPRTVTVSGNMTVSCEFEINKYTLTASAGENGEITPEGVTEVQFGANQTYTIMPNEGYLIDELKIDGASVNPTTNYTFNHINANHTIAVTFKIKTYTITATAGENGTITPNGETIINHGENQTYTIKPNAGYKVSKITVDGATIPSANTYTFNIVVANHTIDVSFEQQTYTITATSDENGTITPNGEIEVVIGTDKEFFIIPNDEYTLDDLTVDGISVMKDIVNSKYTLKSITADHAIHAKFRLLVGVSDLTDNSFNVWAYENTIYCKADSNQDLTIQISDISGKVISVHDFNSEIKVNLSNAKGIYIVRIIENDIAKYSKKLILK